MRLFADGWYTAKEDAQACLAACESMGARAIGLVESTWGTWGIIYVADRVLFEGHVLDSRNALWAPVREKARAR